MRRPKFLDPGEFNRTLAIVFTVVTVLSLVFLMFGCFGHYQYSVDRAIDPPKNGEFGNAADIRKYCDEQKNDVLCKEALTRGRVQEKSSGWGLLPPGPTVSPYPEYFYGTYGISGYPPPTLTFPPCIYYDPQDLVGHPECGWKPPITEEKKKETSP